MYSQQQKSKPPSSSRPTAASGGSGGISRFVFLAGAVIACLVLWHFVLAQIVVSSIVAVLPTSIDKALGDSAAKQVESELLRSPHLQSTIDRLCDEVLQGLKKSGSQYDFDFQCHITTDKAVNAFALPGGRMFVNSGLILASENASEVAGVLAHEFAHVIHRHGVRRLVESQLTRLVTTGAALFLLHSLFSSSSNTTEPEYGDYYQGEGNSQEPLFSSSTSSRLGLSPATSKIAQILGGATATLLSLSFSRDQEREADVYGFDLLETAGLSPVGMTSFFRKLKDIASGSTPQGSSGLSADYFSPHRWLAMASTHPATDERVSYLVERWEEVPENLKRNLRKEPNVGESWERFKQEVKNAI